MHLDWTALGQVAAVSTGVTVAVVVVFALGVLGLAQLEGARDQQGRTSNLGLTQAALCFWPARPCGVRDLPDRPAVPLTATTAPMTKGPGRFSRPGPFVRP
ncbi:hypothetical protein SVIOM74S_09618 [Streptomyces violarus]